MNLQSYILLAIVLAAFILVVRYVYRGGGKRDCCRDGNGCEHCGGCS